MTTHPLTGSTLPRAREQPPPPTVLGLLGFRLSLAVPAALGIVGIATEGLHPNAYNAIFWGAVATLAFAESGRRSRDLGLTSLDWPELLGSIVASPGGRLSRSIGLLTQQAVGVAVAVIWIHASALAGQPADWASGVAFGALLWLPALLLLSTLRTVHVAIRRGAVTDPGPAALRLGQLTPVSILVALLAYGAVLGLGYQFLPLDVPASTVG